MKNFTIILTILSLYGSNCVAQWNIHTVDNTGDAGIYSNIDYDNEGNPHIVYRVDNSVKYSYWTEAGWQSTVIWSPTGAINGVSFCLDKQNNTAHVVFTRSHDAYLEHSDFVTYLNVYKNTVLSSTTLASTSNNINIICPSICLVQDNNTLANFPCITYSMQVNSLNQLRFCYKNLQTGTWTQIIVDSNCGTQNDIATDSDGNIHISYYDNLGGDLKYAYYDWENWYYAIVDGLFENVGSYNSIAIDENDRANITYYDATNARLKYAKVTPLF